VLERHLARRGASARVSPDALGAGAWDEDLELLLRSPRPAAAAAPGAAAAAREIARLLGVDSLGGPD
jgi:hypothetical protein